jgi:hypothetical protein
MHLMSGPPAVQESPSALSVSEPAGVGPSELAAVKANLARLEAEVRELKDLLAKVCSELGMKD